MVHEGLTVGHLLTCMISTSEAPGQQIQQTIQRKESLPSPVVTTFGVFSIPLNQDEVGEQIRFSADLRNAYDTDDPCFNFVKSVVGWNISGYKATVIGVAIGLHHFCEVKARKPVPYRFMRFHEINFMRFCEILQYVQFGSEHLFASG